MKPIAAAWGWQSTMTISATGLVSFLAREGQLKPLGSKADKVISLTPGKSPGYRKVDLQIAKNAYIERSRQIFKATEQIETDSYGLLEIFSKSKLVSAKAKLPNYYVWLKECDEAYTEQMSLHGALNDLNFRNAQLSIVERARSVFLSSLHGYERALSNIEASINFRTSTGLAILAIAISAILGVN